MQQIRMAKRVKVVVPASSANLGPGFDALGLALGLYNTVEFEVIPLGEGLDVDVRGLGSESLPAGDQNLVMQAFNEIATSVGYGPVALYCRTTNDIPLSAGLGSSAAATVGGLAGANALFEAGLSRTALLTLAAEMEGHPDNVAAAIFGSLTMVAYDGGQLHCRELSVPNMEVVVVTPDIEVSTDSARAALPDAVPMRDAVHNIGHALFVTQALQKADYATLAWATRDRLHEYVRREMIPGYNEAIVAGKAAGAVAVTISGAGPSLAAFAPNSHQRIAREMQAAFEGVGVAAKARVLPVDKQGVQISVLW